MDKRILKDFKKSYITELTNICNNDDMILLNKILNDISITRKKLNVKALLNLRIEYWLIRGWTKSEADEKIKEIKQKRKKPKYTCLQKQFWINKGFSEEYAINKIKEIQIKNSKSFNEKRKNNPDNYKTSSPMKVDFWINKGFSEKQALYKIKTQRKVNKEYWITRGFSEKAANEKIKEFQIQQNKKVKNKINTLNINYWTNKGFSLQYAKEKLKERQAVGRLDKFIERYGEIEGKKRWEERQIKWQKTMQNKSSEEKQRINKLKGITLENMIRKWGEIDGSEKYNHWLNKSNIFYSSISQHLFKKLLEIIPDKQNVNFASHNREKLIRDKKRYFYDFCYKNKIIEFNGDLFHANPNIFKEYDKPNPYNKNLTAKQIWEYDNEKRHIAEKNGYEIFIVWESEYYENPFNIINNCVKFLNE